MKRIKMFGLLIVYVVMTSILLGCSSNTRMYELFFDEDLALFQNSELQLTINGNTYILGMRKDDIESMLGERGEGYRHSASMGADSHSDGNWIINPESYENYQTVNNYYYYPKNNMAVIYRSVEDGKETNNPAVLISVNNPALTDSDGFSPGSAMFTEIKDYVVNKYGEEVSKDITGGFVELHYNEFGDFITGGEWVTSSNRPGAWKTYYAHNSNKLDAITVGCRKSYIEDSDIYQLWR